MNSTTVRSSSSAIGTTRLPVTGMTCGSCPATIEMELTAVPGVASARVDLVSNEAVVEHDPRKASRAALVSAIGHAGYRVPSDHEHPSPATEHGSSALDDAMPLRGSPSS